MAPQNMPYYWKCLQIVDWNNGAGMTHFIDVFGSFAADISEILDRAKRIESVPSNALKGKSVGLIFEKPSNRTRLSFEVGIQRLGGQAIYIKGDDIGMGDREPISHVSRVMSRYFDLIVYRTTDHQRLMEFADILPCQSLMVCPMCRTLVRRLLTP